MSEDVDTPTWITERGGRAASIRVRRCLLEVVAGPDTGVRVEVETPLIRIGARKSCELVLTDGKVSGHHLEIALDESGYRLRDLGSKNGTYVGGLRVNDAYVPAGAVIALGATRVRFQPLKESVELVLSGSDRFGALLGQSAAMRELFARLEKLAGADTTVLVTGETGSGKELVAEALHERSPRADKPFVVLDCGTIPASLIESELFGHEKGAFTGALQRHAGAFERADGGTLFLDEIGELPLDLQSRLLGALERREIRRLGGQRPVPVDIRVVAATNRDLGVEVNRGRFREDLFYRLAVARVHVPALRDRKADIPLLAEHFATELGAGPVPQATIDLMMRHDWPGNVRELKNAVERAVVLAEVPTAVGAPPRAGEPPADPGRFLQVAVDLERPLRTVKQDLERRYVVALLERHGGNVSSAARAAGVDRVSVHKMLHRLGVDNPRRGG